MDKGLFLLNCRRARGSYLSSLLKFTLRLSDLINRDTSPAILPLIRQILKLFELESQLYTGLTDDELCYLQFAVRLEETKRSTSDITTLLNSLSEIHHRGDQRSSASLGFAFGFISVR